MYGVEVRPAAVERQEVLTGAYRIREGAEVFEAVEAG